MSTEYDNYGYNKDLKELARKLRKDSTKAEIRLWSEVLRAGKMKGYTFLRQRPVLNYIADFMCKELQLIIEVDGYSHEDERQWYEDLDRQKELEEKGFTILRFTDDEVMNDLKNVERSIKGWVEDHPPSKGDFDETSIKNRFEAYIRKLQDEICDTLEAIDGRARFRHDDWERDGGGGGHTRVIEKGDVFEKGGVNISSVHGELPELIRKRFEVEEGWFWAGGLSLVIHPKSPMVPTVHANYRYFELYDDAEMNEVRDQWFGGGADLTPYYLWDEDAVHFHQVLKAACDNHGKDLYPKFKKECDEYFYNDHRSEGRGIGGLFFDYLRSNEERTAEDWYNFTTDVGDAFLDSYVPIIKRREDEKYSDQQRYFQEIRRGRYVEFNLIHDRGTLFGLKTNGRTESILMSLPPRVRWDYDFEIKEDSREAYLLDRLENPIDWIEYGEEEGILNRN
ncbi:oxygen-dependent coproporphyrinogen oxidase [Aliifodinibius salipaludis]|uniref:coproporphyrinogen oxidase n=1 Tax=Fodinibius salipaludis TaxID=2032627 RepID=A0A2A2G9V2_9BACT|nr:oxygen-dependent coproporphyrinogen oxidase [Aliifodinibius salipaludis]PAU94526.1 oxygen-dependent coproporphyrinogen oxidase [Aliifodinibius salipaludis]